MRTAVISPWVEERLIGGKSQEGSFPGGWTRSVSRSGRGSHGRVYLLRLIQRHASFLCILLGLITLQSKKKMTRTKFWVGSKRLELKSQ